MAASGSPFELLFPQHDDVRATAGFAFFLSPIPWHGWQSQVQSSPFSHVGAGHTMIPRACASKAGRPRKPQAGKRTPPPRYYNTMSLTAFRQCYPGPSARVSFRTVRCMYLPDVTPAAHPCRVSCTTHCLAGTVTSGRSDLQSNLAAGGLNNPVAFAVRTPGFQRLRHYLPPGPLGRGREFQRGA